MNANEWQKRKKMRAIKIYRMVAKKSSSRSWSEPWRVVNLFRNDERLRFLFASQSRKVWITRSNNVRYQGFLRLPRSGGESRIFLVTSLCLYVARSGPNLINTALLLLRSTALYVRDTCCHWIYLWLGWSSYQHDREDPGSITVVSKFFSVPCMRSSKVK